MKNRFGRRKSKTYEQWENDRYKKALKRLLRSIGSAYVR